MKTIQYQNKTIIFVPTAHVSAQSVMDVKHTIMEVQPDAVCIELDVGRAHALQSQKQVQEIDIKQILKSGQAFSFIVNLILSSYQKRIATDLNTEVGGEMRQAIASAKELDIPLYTIDRDIKITMRRIWNNLGLYQKANLAVSLITSLFESDTLEIEDVEALKNSDLLYESIKELDDKLPEISEVLLHERNYYMAEKLKTTPGTTIVCVIGAAHEAGIIAALNESHSLQELNTTPPQKKRRMNWIVPILLVLILGILTLQNPNLGYQQLLIWLALCSGLATLGAMLAKAHPLTILVAFLGAPIGALSPVLAVGLFTGLTEAYKRPPRVLDFETLSQDILQPKMWYHNRVLRILLVAILTNLLSALGTFIATGSMLYSLLN